MLQAKLRPAIQGRMQGTHNYRLGYLDHSNGRLPKTASGRLPQTTEDRLGLSCLCCVLRVRAGSWQAGRTEPAGAGGWTAIQRCQRSWHRAQHGV
eukprot:scaffold15467_cov109-Isochrysis_galbana.AAC.2